MTNISQRMRSFNNDRQRTSAGHRQSTGLKSSKALGLQRAWSKLDVPLLYAVEVVVSLRGSMPLRNQRCAFLPTLYQHLNTAV